MKKFIEYLKQLFNFMQEQSKPEIENNVENSGSTQEVEVIEEEQEPFNYNGTVILLDNGHASSTPGKRSPVFDDGTTQFFEYEFNRDIVKRIAEKLEKLGITYHIIVPEVDKDITLSTRASRANKYCKEYGKDKCLFISIHSNAAGNGEWMNARGWSVWTTVGNTKSDAVATIFFEEAEKILPKYKMTLRKDMSDGDPDYEENFTVLYKTNCRAILTENLFQDNKIDAAFLMSEEGRNAIAEIHINAIKRICSE